MDYSSLKHNFHFVVLRPHYGKGKFHIKNQLLCCPERRLFIRQRQRGYGEIIVDLERTITTGLFAFAYYLGEHWDWSIEANELGLCNKCAKSLDYVEKELSVSLKEQKLLIESNRQLILEAIRSWPN